MSIAGCLRISACSCRRRRVRESLETRIGERLRAIRDGHLLRTLRPPTGIDFSSNDYLGLANHPRLKRAMIDAVDLHGVGSTGSRLLRGEREAFTAIERKFAAFKHTERALYFSSGYLANLAVLTTLPERGDVIFSDERNHASLVDGVRLSAATRVVFPHNSLDELARLLRAQGQAGHAFVVTESLFSMDGDVPPLADYAALCRSAGATLVVDEAHAVGVYGQRGSGLIEEAGIEGDRCVSINTAGKALGVSGAFVAGPAWAIDYLIQRGRSFIFSTAPPPSLAAALDASLDIVINEPGRRTQLAGRVKYLRAALAAAGVTVPAGTTPIIPIVLGDNDRALLAAAELQARGFDVRAIRPPSVAPGTARLRISVNLSLSDETLDRFVTALSATGIVQCFAASS
jgi:8-amino-7-oxononanoate synthase